MVLGHGRAGQGGGRGQDCHRSSGAEWERRALWTPRTEGNRCVGCSTVSVLIFYKGFKATKTSVQTNRSFQKQKNGKMLRGAS